MLLYMYCAIKFGVAWDQSLYECVGVLWYWVFFRRLLWFVRFWTVILSWIEVFFTLGDGVSSESHGIRCGSVLINSEYIVFLLIYTLRASVSYKVDLFTGSGSYSIHFS